MRKHVYDGERCIHCGVNIYDCDCENDECCNAREPMTYTTGYSSEDRGFVAAVAEFPSLSWIADTAEAALDGLTGLVDDIIK